MKVDWTPQNERKSQDSAASLGGPAGPAGGGLRVAGGQPGRHYKGRSRSWGLSRVLCAGCAWRVYFPSFEIIHHIIQYG